MGLKTTVGQLMVNSVLPEDMRDYERVLDKKSLGTLLTEVAAKHPEKYRDISFQLGRVGREFAYRSGGDSVGLAALRRAKVAEARRKRLQPEIQKILDDDSLSDKDRNNKLVLLAGEILDQERNEILDESLAENNPLARQLKGAGRGSPMNLASLRGSDGLYQDHRGRIIPIPVLSSYSQGLRPAEYWAGTYGARQGVLAVKLSTQDAGYLSKLLNQINHRLLVVDTDQDGEPETLRGLPVDVDDRDNEGALLAASAGGYARNTTLTPKILGDLRRQGLKRILVRSPMAASSPQGGLYARDVGVREFGTLPVRGENVGLVAAQALSEPISQSQLCLAAGTLVRMADWTVRPIEDVKPYDWVMGSDLAGNLLPVRVVRTYDNGKRECVRTTFREAKTRQFVELVSTGSHKLLAQTKYQAAQVEQVENGVFPVAQPCAVFSARLLLSRTEYPVVAIRQEQVSVGELATYDLEVDHPDHLFVLANGLIVSNSAKHTGGVAGESKGVSGFDAIQQMVQVPSTFKGGAAHATRDGRVQSVSPAPAGGHFVTIDGQQHYVGTSYKPTVKPGDIVEAGDVISDGIPNPSIITEHKGIGEGRRYFVKAFMDTVRQAGMSAHRRNVELLGRGLINHVRLTDEIGDFAPDDVVPYSLLEASYQPREGGRTLKPREAVGMYLEKPYLHYSIGTRIKPSMLPDFDEFGVPAVAVHAEAPPFAPEMIRGSANLHHDPDWQTRLFGSGLKGSLLKAVHRGGTSDETGTSFVPGRAKAVDFGRSGGPVQNAKRNLGY